MTRRAVCRFFAFARVCGFVSVGSCGFVCFVGGSEWRLASLNFTPQRWRFHSNCRFLLYHNGERKRETLYATFTTVPRGVSSWLGKTSFPSASRVVW